MVPEKDDPEVTESADNFSIALDRYKISAVPGESACIKITISNQDLIENSYIIAVRDIPQSWIADPLEQIHVLPGSEQTVTLTISPPKTPESQAGRYRVFIEVVSESDQSQSKNVTFTLTVQAFHDFQSEIQPQQLAANHDLNVIINNLGNTREIFEVGVDDQEGKFSYNPSAAKMVIPPGKTESSRIRATLKIPHLFWGKRRYNATARVSSQGKTSQEHDLEILSTPAFSAWILLAPLFLCLVLGCYVTMILTSNTVANVFDETAKEVGSWSIAEMPGNQIDPYTPIPTNTPTNKPSPSPTITPTHTTSPTPTVSPTPTPDAMVIVDELPVWTGPGGEFYQDNNLLGGETLEVIGQFDNCNWLKITAEEGIEGWISGAANIVQLNLICADIPNGTYRPKNGTLVFSDTGLDGQGELVVENGTSRDGLIILIDSSAKPLLAFYVRSDKEYNLEGIPDGDYEIYFSQGEEWDGDLRQFTSRISYQRFEDILNFTTNGNLYRVWTMTLHPVPLGSAKTTLVDPEEFPDLRSQPPNN